MENSKDTCSQQLHNCEETKSIIDENYMLWLERFTKAHANFTDADWLYGQKGIRTQDYNNVTQLKNLFKSIESYADRNYIPVKFEGCDRYYVISFNGISYTIGMLMGRTFYCKRKKTFQEGSIPFHSIAFNILQPRVEEVDCLFNEMFKHLETLTTEYEIPINVTTQKLSDKLFELKRLKQNQ